VGFFLTDLEGPVEGAAGKQNLEILIDYEKRFTDRSYNGSLENANLRRLVDEFFHGRPARHFSPKNPNKRSQ
jgi:hypothetical protein